MDYASIPAQKLQQALAAAMIRKQVADDAGEPTEAAAAQAHLTAIQAEIAARQTV
jgi:hypothetical protein